MPSDFTPRTNDAVITKWMNGVSARNHKRTLASIACEDGYTELYSYDLKIGSRTPTGSLVLADYTAPANGFKSQTTSCHVNLAKAHACRENAVVMHPLVWESSALSDEVPF